MVLCRVSVYRSGTGPPDVRIPPVVCPADGEIVSKEVGEEEEEEEEVLLTAYNK